MQTSAVSGNSCSQYLVVSSRSVLRREINVLSNPSHPDFSKYYVPDVGESQNYCDNNFTIVNEVGRGGFGCVYRMRNKVDNIDYAVKKIELEDLAAEENNRKALGNNDRVIACVMAFPSGRIPRIS